MAQTTIHLTSDIAVSDVQRFGTNLRYMNTYYDTGMFAKNLVHRNPGFEGTVWGSMIRCSAGTATSCTDDQSTTQWGTDFWKNATYEIVLGTAKGRNGTISAYASRVFTFSDSGVAPTVGDYMIVRLAKASSASDGWWTTVSGSGTIATEFSDLPPSSTGTQAIRLTALGTSDVAQIRSLFDTTTGQSFIQLNGAYQLSFKAKGVSGSNALVVDIRRSGGSVFINSQTVSLTNSWQTYVLNFTASETSAVGSISLSFSPTQSDVLMDDVQLIQIDSSASNPTAFRDPIVDALKTLHPGSIRYWNEQLGESLDNMIADEFGRKRTYYSRYSTTGKDIEPGLHEFLQLAEEVNADPWIVLPIVFTDKDIQHLMEYLGGDQSTSYGAKRASRGHSLPWTSSFNHIYVEFGNEAWNSVFNSGTMLYSLSYGRRGNDIFTAARASPYVSPKFSFILGVQSSVIANARNVQNTSYAHDALATTFYHYGKVDNYATDEDLFGPLFAVPENMTTGFFTKDMAVMVNSSNHSRSLYFYEGGIATSLGSISQARLDDLTPSLGAGLSDIVYMLLSLRDLGVKVQEVFTLPQYQYSWTDGSGRTSKIWGILRLADGVRTRYRPAFLTIQMANEVLNGNMMRTIHGGDNPTWNQSSSNGYALTNAHYLHSFFIVNDTTGSLILINYHRTSPLSVTFSGSPLPSGTVTMRQLNGSTPTLNNEISENVQINTHTFDAFNSTALFSLPPFSLTVLTWDLLIGDVCSDGVCTGTETELNCPEDCTSPAGPACIDNDLDSFSLFDASTCTSGTDCDDSSNAIYPGATEICGNGIDENCDSVDDTCSAPPSPPTGGGGSGTTCTSGDTRSCGSDVGECASGIQSCSNGVWGVCFGATLPVQEICDVKDNDCNGKIDDRNCDCLVGQTRTCGSNIGMCQEGVSTCDDTGTWGSCQGEISALSTDYCDNDVDDNCDGRVDEQCVNGKNHCENNIQDSGEDGVDCGGTCAACNQQGRSSGNITGIVVVVVILIIVVTALHFRV